MAASSAQAADLESAHEGGGSEAASPAAAAVVSRAASSTSAKRYSVIGNPQGRRLTSYLKTRPLSESRKSLLFGFVVDNRELKVVTTSIVFWGIITLFLGVVMCVTTGAVHGTFSHTVQDVNKPPDLDTLPPQLKQALQDTKADAVQKDLGDAGGVIIGLVFFTVLMPFISMGVFSASVYSVRMAVSQRSTSAAKKSLVAVAICGSLFLVMMIFAIGSYASLAAEVDSASLSISNYMDAVGSAKPDEKNLNTISNPMIQYDAITTVGTAQWGALGLLLESIALVLTTSIDFYMIFRLYKLLVNNQLGKLGGF